MRLETSDDRTTIWLRQSSINNYMTCPERFRFAMHMEPEVTTDAALIGTAVHAGCEYILKNKSATSLTLTNASDLVRSTIETTPYRPAKFSKSKDITQLAVQQFYAWVIDIYPQITGEILGVEVSFDLPLVETELCDIRLEGTMDLVTDSVVMDWKFPGREYNALELKRWAVQPTVYTWAATELYGTEYNEFVYGIVPRGFDTLVFAVDRGPRDWAWMKEQAIQISEMVLEWGTDRNWPRNDQHWLCSAKWCPAWELCKGSHYA